MSPKSRSSDRKSTGPVLLSGGNPQIPKGEGDAPVQAFIQALSGWKQARVKRIDALVVRTIPNVCKAVKWNSPFYGVEPGCWFLSFHIYARYIKLTFFRGLSLDPVPPVSSKSQDTRYYHVTEEEMDEDLLVRWIEQASRLPGERM